GLDVSVEEQSSGAPWGRDWVAGNLLARGVFSGIQLEVHGGDDVSAAAWRRVSEESGAPPLPVSPGLCIVTLSGATHEATFRELRSFLVQERGAAEYDESDGFTNA